MGSALAPHGHTSRWRNFFRLPGVAFASAGPQIAVLAAGREIRGKVWWRNRLAMNESATRGDCLRRASTC